MSLSMLPVQVPGRIPKIVHLIWVGGPVPAYVLNTWEMWADHVADHGEQWKIKFWTDEAVLNSPLAGTLRTKYEYDIPWRGVADLLRLQAVSLYGGIYVDCDTVPLKPLDSLVGDRQPWIGTAPRTREQRVIVNATFGFPQGHEFIAEVWDHASKALERGVTNEHFVAGPEAFGKVYREYTGDPVEIDYRFETEWTRDLQKMVLDSRIDVDEMRRRYPDAPVLHVVLR